MPKAIDNFPDSRKVYSEETKKIKMISQTQKDYYKNIIIYLDEHIYFNYLKATNPDFGLSFNTEIIHYLKLDVGVSIPIILYQRAFPEDEEIIDFILEIIKTYIENKIYLSLEEIREIKNNLL